MFTRSTSRITSKLASTALRSSVSPSRSALLHRSVATRAPMYEGNPAFAEIGAKQYDMDRIPVDIRGKLKTGTPLTSAEKDVIAGDMLVWASSVGAVQSSHWFHPVRGGAAEKHDAFINLDFKTGKIIEEFSGTRLFWGETDGSSFPNGGLRVTHRAAAFVAWDPNTAPFVRGDTLFIPSAFMAHTGEALDDKTLLLRSQDVISKEAVRLLRHLGDNKTERVVSNVGWEQEFFLIDRDAYLARPDLVHAGRALLGQVPHRNQQMEQNYFSAVPPRVKAFWQEVQAHLWQLGLSQNVFHAEVAPSQYEYSTIFSLTSTASDENILSMSVLEEIAAHHNFSLLLHEKPFAGINGSGKHCNWGLNTDSGSNIFRPGKTAEEQARFMTFVSALAHTITRHGDLLRISVGTAGNDHRLGAQEAPPAIVSMYTGDIMEEHIHKIVAGGDLAGYAPTSDLMNTGAGTLQPVQRGQEDRNRTAPFPFCGNRFEFRAVGSSQNISFPMTLLNAAVSDSLAHISSKIEGGQPVRDAVASTFKENLAGIFNGNGYDPAWVVEAEKRGLFHFRTSAESFPELHSDKNTKLLTGLGVYTSENALKARAEVLHGQYAETLVIEATTLMEMLNTGIIPAIVKDQVSIGDLKGSYFDKKLALYDAVIGEAEKLEAAVDAFPEHEDAKTQATYARETLKPLIESAREVADAVERKIPAELYPFMKLDEVLFKHHGDGGVF